MICRRIYIPRNLTFACNAWRYATRTTAKRSINAGTESVGTVLEGNDMLIIMNQIKIMPVVVPLFGAVIIKVKIIGASVKRMDVFFDFYKKSAKITSKQATGAYVTATKR